jgi:hypothetical protein
MPPEIKNLSIDRVRYQLRVSAIKDLNANPLRSGVHGRGYLPHAKHEGAQSMHLRLERFERPCARAFVSWDLVRPLRPQTEE